MPVEDNRSTTWKDRGKRALAWIGGSLLLMLALLALAGSIWAGLALLGVTALVFPPLADRLRASPLFTKARPWAAAILVILFFVATQRDMDAEEQVRLAQQAARQDSIAAVSEDSLRQYLGSNRSELVQGARAQLEMGEYRAAASRLRPFAEVSDDAEIDSLHEHALAGMQAKQDSAQVERLVERLRQVPASNTELNHQLYGQLVQLQPDNQRFKDRRDHYANQLQRASQERAERLQLFGPMPERSAWDGTYSEVKDYLRQVMNDPSSLDMDACTSVYHTPEGWLVGCDYRGKNAFGGVVRNSNWFIIRHGRVITHKPASAYSP